MLGRLCYTKHLRQLALPREVVCGSEFCRLVASCHPEVAGDSVQKTGHRGVRSREGLGHISVLYNKSLLRTEDDTSKARSSPRAPPPYVPSTFQEFHSLPAKDPDFNTWAF